ncbi:aldo/keto reductase [Aureibaculum sp. 2210JD6-5]|uniref:aldo/keto reductase n=1 Tax=Aureibaculum sp. 2210JD6-5 TaxID=3103957 RepID=UPI002AAC752A|nr:aldo/keto reductase [Aureibaculum sp. 2210JD6-5]MDY7396486.1 aldo/keto reductase [Aureibaculum sp. 2210JD6-5]
MKNNIYTRREVLKLTGLSTLGLLAYPGLMSYKLKEKMLLREIPSSKQKIPVVGLGTWQTFDVGDSQEERKTLLQVLVEMNKLGGSVIDSSPMYGSSERVVGDLTSESGLSDAFFYATKVWTSGKEAGIKQMDQSFKLMKRKKIDLMQIHNLVDWKTHVKTLKEWKEKGKIRYWGITHYTDSSHSSLEKVIQQENPDFVQFNYSIRERNAEKSLFETIRKHDTAVIINQPYESGSLFRITRGKELPKWSKDYDINSWGQFFLKFILSNELVTCVIPGTSKPKHVIDNMMAGYGKMPDAKTREKMYSFIKSM